MHHKGRWVSIDRQVKNEQELFEAIPFDLDETDIYYSTSCFLEPQSVSKPSPSDVILGHDFVIDIDEDFSLEGLETARLKAIELVNRLDYKLKYIAFTGSKGFVLVYENPLKLPKDHKKRARFIKQHRQNQIKVIEGVDKITTSDPYRIIRLPGSVNTKTGYRCTIISKELLLEPITELLAHIPYITKERPAICLTKGEGELHRGIDEVLPPPAKQIGVGECSGRNSQPPFFSSAVVGTKDRSVLLMRWDKYWPYSHVKSKLNTAIKRYKLGDVYCFETEKDWYCIGLKTFQRKRLAKILRYLRCKNTYRGQIPLDMEYIEKIEGKDTNSYVSRGHERLVSILSHTYIENKNSHGRMVLGVMKNG